MRERGNIIKQCTAGFYVYRMCPFKLNIPADTARKGLQFGILNIKIEPGSHKISFVFGHFLCEPCISGGEKRELGE